FRHRLVVFIVSLAGHGILSKYIYTHPPHGVSIVEAKIGGMLMYYGGDVVDIVLIFIFFNHWYIAVGRKRSGLEIRTS
ncbi:MAG: cytochrome c oxidase assembly protein, partial [Bacillus sp. (in: firmicutes)]